jgi:vacuolar iron transporter family protein
MGSQGDHFKGQTAVDHVVEAQANGIIASAEIHGTEIPGSISAATDAARETVIVLLLLNLFSIQLMWAESFTQTIFIVFIFGWMIWKIGRSAWLGWSRLERLHRILEEERWEIEHNRGQEREELKALYAAKGFEGKLLEDVLDVLMADGDRLLKVMIEEELGLTLEVHEHPLQQSLGAALGVFIASVFALSGYMLGHSVGLYIAALLTIILSSYISAKSQGNHFISAVIWNLAIAFLSIGMAHFLLDYLSLIGWLR